MRRAEKRKIEYEGINFGSFLWHFARKEAVHTITEYLLYTSSEFCETVGPSMCMYITFYEIPKLIVSLI